MQVLPQITIKTLCLTLLTLSSSALYAENIRKSYYSLTSDEKKQYENVVAAMKKLPTTDYRNWYFQSGIHGHFDAKDSDVISHKKFILDAEKFNLVNREMTFKDKDGKPYTKYISYYPTENQDIQAWDLCHQWGAGSPLFLLWHRVYVHSFEQIGKTVSHNPNFSLPYWDYTDLTVHNKRLLPPEFDNKKSVLYEKRSPKIYLNKPDVRLDKIFNQRTLPEFSYELESTVHGYVHDAVGDPNQEEMVMGVVRTAAQDPIFWLHHANIDRLWSCWEKQNGQNFDWTQYDKGQKYAFVQPDGSIQNYSVKDMANLVKTMSYSYDQYQDCTFNALQSTQSLTTRLLTENVNIGKTPYLLQFPTDAKTLMATSDSTRPTYLSLQGIMPTGNIVGLINIMLVSRDGKHSEYVGSLSFFGQDDDAHSHAHKEHHLSRQFEITDALEQLRAAGVNNEDIIIKIQPDSRLTPAKQKALAQSVDIHRIEIAHH